MKFNFIQSQLSDSIITKKTLAVLKELLPDIIQKSGIRNVDEIFNFLIDSSYEILPLPIIMIIKKDVYVSVLSSNKDKVLKLIIDAK